MDKPGPAPAPAHTRTRTRELRESVIIAAPPEEVYASISDVKRMPLWSPECVKVLLLPRRSESRPSFIGFNRNGLRHWFTLCQVTTADAPGEFAFRVSVAGLPIAIWGFRLRHHVPPHTAAATGSTHVTQYWHDLRQGPFGAVADLLGRAVAGTSPAARVRVNRAGMITTLHRLKHSVEDAAGGTTPQ
ncbi:SRPBCC family protein [Streptomyces sp. NPDC002039]|uniref:SRPBCC family protein n=1 Tax=Streptomyces sp. NPDC002039 TaxID=3154660 RepID=UPI00332CE9E4